MATLTVWNNSETGSVHLVQLSDEPQSGSNSDQISRIANLPHLVGHSCVSTDYTGPIPQVEASLWRWDGSQMTAGARP